MLDVYMYYMCRIQISSHTLRLCSPTGRYVDSHCIKSSADTFTGNIVKESDVCAADMSSKNFVDKNL